MKTNLQKLRTAIQNALDKCMEAVKLKDGSSGFQEPDYVARIAKKLPERLAHDFPALMEKKAARWGLKFRSCFIHQKPKVTYTDNGKKITCELGDLMLLLKDGSKYSAAIIQFKRPSKTLVKIIDAKELNQLRIYTDWPTLRFAYKNEKEQYQVCPRIVGTATQYGFICPNQKLKYFVDKPSKAMLANGMTLAEYIVSFIQRKIGGWMLPKNEKDDDGWSKLIWDVIGKIENAKFKRRNIGCGEEHRLRGGLFSMLTSPLMCFDVPSVDKSACVRNRVENGGMAVVIIEKENSLLVSRRCVECIDGPNLFSDSPSVDEIRLRGFLEGRGISKVDACVVSELLGER